VKRITNVNKTVRNHDGYYLAIEEKQNKTKQSNKQTKQKNNKKRVLLKIPEAEIR